MERLLSAKLPCKVFVGVGVDDDGASRFRDKELCKIFQELFDERMLGIDIVGTQTDDDGTIGHRLGPVDQEREWIIELASPNGFDPITEQCGHHILRPPCYESASQGYHERTKEFKAAFFYMEKICLPKSMSTIDAFNTTLKNFLQELTEVFPNEPGIGKVKLFLGTFDGLTAINKRAAMDPFLEAMAPHADLISGKNSKLFKKVELPGGVSLKDLWKKASDATKDATWQYLQMLFLLASTAASVPPDMLSAIEGMASNYADKIKTGEMDLGSVSNMLLSGDFASMLGAPEPKK